MHQKGVKDFFGCNVGKSWKEAISILTRLNSPFLLDELPMMVVGTLERSWWIIGSKRYCKVVEPGVTVPRTAMVLVWLSFWMAVPKSSAKENACLGAHR